MKKHSKAQKMRNKPSGTVGIDLRDRFCSYCILDGDGEVMESGRVRTEAGAFRRQFAGAERMWIAMESIGTLGSTSGAGPLVAATYVLTVDGAQAVAHSRSAGAFLGLRGTKTTAKSRTP